MRWQTPKKLDLESMDGSLSAFCLPKMEIMVKLIGIFWINGDHQRPPDGFSADIVLRLQYFVNLALDVWSTLTLLSMLVFIWKLSGTLLRKTLWFLMLFAYLFPRESQNWFKPYGPWYCEYGEYGKYGEFCGLGFLRWKINSTCLHEKTFVINQDRSNNMLR